MHSGIPLPIKPLLGRMPASKLKLGNIEDAQADIAAGKTAKPRADIKGGVPTGGEGVASRAISTLQ